MAPGARRECRYDPCRGSCRAPFDPFPWQIAAPNNAYRSAVPRICGGPAGSLCGRMAWSFSRLASELESKAKNRRNEGTKECVAARSRAVKLPAHPTFRATCSFSFLQLTSQVFRSEHRCRCTRQSICQTSSATWPKPVRSQFKRCRGFSPGVAMAPKEAFHRPNKCLILRATIQTLGVGFLDLPVV